MSELKVVASYPFLSVAQVAQAALEAEGIPSFFENAEIVNADWLLGNAVGDVKLLVPVDRETAARAILANKRLHETRRTAAGSDNRTEQCLACGAVLPVEATTCGACGWTFADEAGEVVDIPGVADSLPSPVIDTSADKTRPEEDCEEGLIRSTSWLHHVFLLMLFMLLLALFAHSTGHGFFGWFNRIFQ